MNKLLLLALLITGIFGCTTNDSDNLFGGISSENKPLEITTRILTTKSVSFVQQYADGAVMGLHITNGKAGQLYHRNSEYKNIRVEANTINNKLKWQQTPTVLLNTESATVFAYYPYQSQKNFNALRIPVHISPDATQTNDYMYGTQATGQKAVNNASPYAILNMNHALSLIAFEVSLSIKGTDSYKLKSIQIGNKAGGTALFNYGTMDISTGQITGAIRTNASTRLTLADPVSLTQIPHSEQQLMVIPIVDPIKKGEIEVLFVINGHTFNFLIPAKTKWEKGKKYLYKLNFNGKNLMFKEVSITEWIPNGKKPALEKALPQVDKPLVKPV